MGAFIDLTGHRYGRLKVVDRADNIGTKTAWNCLCECGEIKAVISRDLKNGHTKSCGCLKTDMATTHGLSKDPEYALWRGMRRRCFSSNDKNYHNYGGRGITVCDRWKDSFENFYADMGPRPSPELTIDRTNNDGPYSPENCRWATWSQQIRNQRVRKTNNSGLKGVTQTKSGKWRARILNNGKDIHLYLGDDFFEVCCRRKSAELRLRA